MPPNDFLTLGQHEGSADSLMLGDLMTDALYSLVRLMSGRKESQSIQAGQKIIGFN